MFKGCFVTQMTCMISNNGTSFVIIPRVLQLYQCRSTNWGWWFTQKYQSNRFNCAEVLKEYKNHTSCDCDCEDFFRSRASEGTIS
jgi:hypothetical protein